MVVRGRHTVHQILVKWSHLDESLATWEDMKALKQHFPATPAWGQPTSYGEGNASTALENAGTSEAEAESVPVRIVGRRANMRQRRPSVRVSGPEWVGPKMYCGAGGI
jgi:hypothetical protein